MHVIYRRVSQEETENVSAPKSDYSHLTIQQQEAAVMLQCDVISLSHDLQTDRSPAATEALTLLLVIHWCINSSWLMLT